MQPQVCYWWNTKPDLCHTVIDHFVKLPLSSGIDYQEISDKTNISIIVNAHLTYLIKTAFNL